MTYYSISAQKDTFFRDKYNDLETTKDGHIRELEDTIIHLKADTHMYRTQANELTLKNQ